MLTTNAKLAIAGIGIGGATIGGGTYYLINKDKEADLPSPAVTKEPEEKAISHWLEKDGRVLLGDSDPEWANTWKAFKETYPKNNAPTGVWAFTNWDTAFDGKEDGLKTKCTTQSQEKIKSNSGELYEAVKKYCTKAKPTSPTPQ